MSAPKYVPHTLADKPRRRGPLPPSEAWTADRPADLTGRQPRGLRMGAQGPDQGYVLRLLPLFEGKVVLTEGEHRADVDTGCVAVALKRASLFGRAPVVHDLDVAYRVFGYLSLAPAELVAARKQLFHGAAHSYGSVRAIADAVPEATLRLTPAEARERHEADWRPLLTI